MGNQTTANQIERATGADEISTLGPAIYGYSRAQAIADGVLVDVTTMSRQAGFTVPVALTSAAWSDCVEWTDEDSSRQGHQDEAGRLWDTLWIAHLAARRAHGEVVAFELYRVPRGGRGHMPRRVSLHMHIGPGDEAEPVITIMLPGED
jgi:hypothetical protein